MIFNSLPDFSEYDRCFIHTDLGPHNTIIGAGGKLILIDLADSGIGRATLNFL